MCTVAFALISAGRVVHERQEASEAGDLQLAALQVDTAHSLQQAAEPTPDAGLEQAVEILHGHSGDALDSLPAVGAARADELLDEIATCGLMLLDAGDCTLPQRDHEELRALLAQASSATRTAASDAERRGLVASLGAITAIGFGGWLLVRSRNQARREREAAAAQVEAGRILGEELQRQAAVDALTGLPNRRALEPALRAGPPDAAGRASSDSVALLILDLDGFKQTNDTLGHLAGDHLLRAVAERLSGVLHSGETLLRLGGDEFAAVLPAVSSDDEPRQLADRLLAALVEPFEVGPRLERLRTSIGAAVGDAGVTSEVLLRRADMALYEAKRAGGSMMLTFEPEMEIRATAASTMSRELRNADFDREFSLVFQPIVDSDSWETVSVEALLRWTSPSLGVVGPNEFIQVAEQSGDICAIGRWVLSTAVAQLAEWDDAGLSEGISLSLNVSSRQFEEDGFVESFLSVVASHGVDPRRLIVEVTESGVIDRGSDTTARLQQLRASGVRIAIDDFGSGYSNLGQMLRLPLDIIKIDRSLLLTLGAMREGADGAGEGPCEVMRAIGSIAQVVGAQVICEGVETDRQARSLRDSGIQYLQGYLTGRPERPEAIARHLLATPVPTPG
ncbi:MAG: EAL domain-containing protein [Microthrixaceae bacterium]